MARKKKTTRKKGRRVERWAWWASLDAGQRRGIVRRGGLVCLLLVIVAGAGYLGSQLDAHVGRQLRDSVGRSEVVFADLPASLERLARHDLSSSVSDLLDHDWLDDTLCQQISERLSTVGWVAEVRSVKRNSVGTFEARARYRVPIALVEQDRDCLMVDAEGVTLPGRYLGSQAWKLIRGVHSPAPVAGAVWEGLDIRAGLDVVEAISREAFEDQVFGVLVENVRGRLDASASHVELVTDREGGRIRWGSAPGFELEENTIGQKVAILRDNYRRTGRLDADHPVIDVSTFPDRFTIPG